MNNNFLIGEDGQKVYLVLKGEGMKLKPKSQKQLKKEIDENKTRLKVISMWKSSSQKDIYSEIKDLKKAML